MKLELVKEYKSIVLGEEIELPKFVVLTGHNGAGKTQLLDAISIGQHIKLTKDETILGQRQLFKSGAFIPINQGQYQLKVLDAEASDIFQHAKPLCSKVTDQSDHEIHKLADNARAKNYRALAKALISARTNAYFPKNSREFKILAIRDGWFDSPNSGINKVSLATIFVRYLSAQNENEYLTFLASKGKDVRCWSAEEFEADLGRPPWEIMDEILAELGLEYRIIPPSEEHIDNVESAIPYVPRLESLNGGSTIGFTDLSSGEQAICTLAFARFETGRGFNRPDVLLLDEPDAHLHPSMVQKMIDVLTKVVLPDLKGGIFMTTHSPTTCALVPKESLFLMTKEKRWPKKTTTNEALQMLCADIPFLSISKENEKQILVEGKSDAFAYTLIWEMLRKKKMIESNGANLNFIASSGTDKSKSGNVSHAIGLMEEFRKGGSVTAFALVDHDNFRLTKGNVHVCGNSERHSLENFILSPVMVAAFLVLEPKAGNWIKGNLPSLEEFGVGDFINLSDEDGQRISYEVLDYLKSNIEGNRSKGDLGGKCTGLDFAKNTLSECKTLGGNSLRLPEWFFKSIGHNIEEAFCLSFPQFQARYAGEGVLAKAVLEAVVKHSPNLLPASLVQSLQELVDG